MKAVLVFLFTLAIVSIVMAQLDAEKEWSTYKVKFGRKYDDENEELLRKKIFIDNLKKIEQHNKLYEEGKTTFKMGVNQFTDLTSEEFKKMYGSGLLHDNQSN